MPSLGTPLTVPRTRHNEASRLKNRESPHFSRENVNLIKMRVLEEFRSIKPVLLIALVSKALIFSLGYIATYLNEGPSHPLSIVMRQFCRWDGPHYLNIAENWYSDVGEQRLFIVFFPLYPVLIRLTTLDSRFINLSALLISNISSIAAMVYLFKLAKLDFGKDAAKRALIYFSLYPTAYFLCAIYTEGLFLALVMACFYYAKRGRWLLSGFLGMLASLTRINGLILLPALLVEYLSQKEWRLKRLDANLFWLGLPSVGFIIYLIINYIVTGDFFTFIDIQRTHWHQNLNPLSGLKEALNWAINAPPYENVTVGYAQIIFAILGLIGAIGSFLLLHPSYSVYTLLTWMMSVSTSFWLSIPRFTLLLFPLFILLGLIGRRKEFNYAIILISSSSLCFFTILFSLGQWAF